MKFLMMKLFTVLVLSCVLERSGAFFINYYPMEIPDFTLIKHDNPQHYSLNSADNQTVENCYYDRSWELVDIINENDAFCIRLAAKTPNATEKDTARFARLVKLLHEELPLQAKEVLRQMYNCYMQFDHCSGNTVATRMNCPDYKPPVCARKYEELVAKTIKSAQEKYFAKQVVEVQYEWKCTNPRYRDLPECDRFKKMLADRLAKSKAKKNWHRVGGKKQAKH